VADPRASVIFADVGEFEALTFSIDNSTITYSSTSANGSASVGLAVTLSASKTVALAADGEPVVGKLIEVFADNTATVQVGDVLVLPGGNGATLTPGLAIVGALNASSAKGYIRAAASGTAAELIKCRGIILDSGTTTAVAVLMC
jgi:hypothetical protein